MVGGVKQYKITWLNLPESKDSWQLASDYDGGIHGGAYVELVEEWEQYKKTDPQYTTQPTTTTIPKATTTQAKAKAKADASSSNTLKRKRSDSFHSLEY